MKHLEAVTFVALRGANNDWAMYAGPADWSIIKVASSGTKLNEKAARSVLINMHGVIDALPWINLDYRE